MTIRTATEADLAEILLLERETATAPHWGMAEYEGMLGGEMRRALLVARDGAKLTGFAVGKVLGAEAELESVVVRVDGRRRGMGSALCGAVMDWSRREGAREILLEVRVGSVGAIKLYEGLGFVAVGRRVGYYREPVEDAVVMRCELGG